MNVLFVCSRNQWRSPTAEAIYKHYAGYNVRSAGTEPSARIRITAKLVGWADLIFVMEKRHKQRLVDRFAVLAEDKEIVILDIADEYGYMDTELVESIKLAVAPYIGNPQ